MWHGACLVELQRAGNDKKPSCSGFILDVCRGHVLTHGSVLWPVLDANHQTMLLSNGQLQGHDLSQYTAKVTIECANTSSATTAIDESHLLGLRENGRMALQTSKCAQAYNVQGHKVGSGPRHLEQLSGTVKCVWRSLAFTKTVRRMLPPSDGWKFTEYDDLDGTDTDNNNNHIAEKQNNVDTGSKQKSSTRDSDDTFQTLPFFLLIELSNSSLLQHTHSSLRLGRPRCQGERVVVVGTPFGALSPEVFINSVSEGLLSNIAGNQGEMLLTDARAIPGTEGAPIYGVDGAVMGMIVASLCWKSTEWIGLSIGCSIHAALSSLPHSDMISPRIMNAFQDLSLRPTFNSSPYGGATSCVSATLRQVALVRCGGGWGSAVVVDGHEGLLLTCGHVVMNSHRNTVTVHRTYPHRQVLHAHVLYTSKPGELYDVAVLKLDQPWDITGEDADRPTVRAPTTGEAVLAVGHACFPEQLNLQPSITRGTVSKVIYQGTTAVLLQSTCAVHAGASGGPLVASDGTIIGLLASNTKDIVSGSSYPHINMSVPLVTIWPIIEEYLQTKDEDVLLRLRVTDVRVKALWTLQGDSPPLHSKL